MKKIYLFAIGGLIMLCISCKVEPAEINYGKDSCAFCKMTIVDRQHAAQIVTTKGRPSKFDAVECMLNQLSEQGLEGLEYVLVADYNEPGQLIDASAAVYLISEGIKSPMGANLSSFADYGSAESIKKQHEGKLYDWKEICAKFDVNP